MKHTVPPKDQACPDTAGAAEKPLDITTVVRPITSHIVETARLAGPIAMHQLARQVMQTTTLILLGTIHPDTIAAGGLAVRISVSTNILSAVMLTVGISISVAQGAGDHKRISSLYWNGLYLAIGLSLVSFIWFSNAHYLLTAMDIPPDVVADTQRCLDIMRWAEPAQIITLGLMRGVLPAFGLARILYALTPITLVLYIGVSFALARGVLGLEPMGWLAVPLALTIVNWISALVMLAMVHATRYRRHIPITKPQLLALKSMLRVGTPVGLVQGLDSLFFFVSTLMIGRLGAVPLAAHQIVMNYGTVTSGFAISSGDAAALRIGFRRGQYAFADARRAGFVGIAMSLVMTTIAATCVGLLPDFFLGLFVDIHSPHNQPIVEMSRSLLLLSVLWTLVDGVYVAALGLPRATNDNRFALIVPVVYWSIGLPTAYVLTAHFGLGLAGYWWAFVVALALNAAILVARFAWVSRRFSRSDAGPPQPMPLWRTFLAHPDG